MDSRLPQAEADPSRTDLCTPVGNRAIPHQLREIAETIRALIGAAFPPSRASLQQATWALEDAATRLEAIQAETERLKADAARWYWDREKLLAELEAVEEQRDAIERELEAPSEHKGMDFQAIRLAEARMAARSKS
jgi:chromosome segregation ATPase